MTQTLPQLMTLPKRRLNQYLATATAEKVTERRRQIITPTSAEWPGEYRNADTGRVYAPHSEAERAFVFGDAPTYAVALGGEGAGKSVAGIIKDLERVRRGMPGIMVSPDLPHFSRSLWPEFRRWCPWEMVVKSQRHRQSQEWLPSKPFELVFLNGASILCGGIETPQSWEGPNVNWAHYDEPRKARDAGGLKVLSGRTRIPGPAGEPPQVWLTTTPEMHWLYDYFGPARDNDDFADFKRNSLVIHMSARDNAPNLAAGYIDARGQTLTENEKLVNIEGQWAETGSERFIPSMDMWDARREQLAPLSAREPLVVALDAGISSDAFGIVAVSRHPNPTRHGDVAARYAQAWQPQGGAVVDFAFPIAELKRLCREYNVVCVVYDPYQLHATAMQLAQEGVAWFVAFNQGEQRLSADTNLLSLVMQGRIAHDGNEALRAHVDNANRKTDAESRKLRIVKRTAGRKIDLAVCLSMAAYQCQELNL